MDIDKVEALESDFNDFKFKDKTYAPNLGRWSHHICPFRCDNGWCNKLNKKCVYNQAGE